MTGNCFFDESKDQSRVKSAIVSKYFDAWASVITGVQNKKNLGNKIAYIDLFAGPGRYQDGTRSTPLLILEKAIQKSQIRDSLVTIFNDKDENNTNSLQQAIDELHGIETLKYKPVVQTKEVGEEIVQMFEQMNLIPTLFFVDPWGYKGLSLRLVNSVIKDWGCDCIFFFNYNRINMGLGNPMVKEHMNCLFGKERADEFRVRLEPLDKYEREMVIVEELCQAIKALGPRYVLPFRFRDDKGTRTSHHLIFVSKGFKGYEIMKEIMANKSSSDEQGVASFEYNPADVRPFRQLSLLFQLSRPLDELAGMLLEDFAGRTLTMRQIYEQHNVDRPYVSRNYKQALSKLEEDGKITASTHRRNSFGDDVQVTFPAL
ncbi:MAG: three-Cys-motif partner protein TcmP [Candidatus Latescibacter sp.]|nr:three-Cys-motif partner protein TcmP [Candidatus Latescibacter sp.]